MEQDELALLREEIALLHAQLREAQEMLERECAARQAAEQRLERLEAEQGRSGVNKG
jgi:Tfp pilus assembly protein PilN